MLKLVTARKKILKTWLAILFLIFCHSATADQFGFDKILREKTSKEEKKSALKKLYRRLALKMHPDKPENRGKEESFKAMKLAYEDAEVKLEQLNAAGGRFSARNNGATNSNASDWKPWRPEPFTTEDGNSQTQNGAHSNTQSNQRAQAEKARAAREKAQRQRAEQAQAQREQAERQRQRAQAQTPPKAPPRPVTPKYEVDYFDVFDIKREADMQSALNKIKESLKDPSSLVRKGFEIDEIQRMAFEGIAIFTDVHEYLTLVANLKDKGIITFAQFETTINAHRSRLQKVNRRNPYQNCFMKMHTVGRILDIKI